MHDTNCYKQCPNYYYFDDLHKGYCTEDENCPEEKSKLIIEKRQCIEDCSNDNLYRFEYNNQCYNYNISSESNISIVNNYTQVNIIEKEAETTIFHINDKIPENKEQLENHVKNIIPDGDNDLNIKYISNNLNNTYIKEEEIEEIKKGKDLILLENKELKISLTNNGNKLNKNISSINLGECENKLKEFYNISENESLLILKVEVLKKDMKKPRIEYEVYYLSNENILYKLDLNVCDDTNIIIYNPMNLYDKNIDKLNSSSDFYKDICYTYTTENETDITLSDRREEYINNDLDACEENCNFTDYDYENNVAICSCKVKKELKSYSEININKTLLYMSFTDIDHIMNLDVMKCYKELFCKEGISYNYGSYIILSICIILSVAVMIFYSKEYIIIKNTINNMDINNMNNININTKKRRKDSNLNKKKEIKQIGKNPKNPSKKKKKIKKDKIKTKNYSINLVQTNHNINLNVSKDLNDNSKIEMHMIDKINEINPSEYNNYELNDLDYLEALKKDNRHFLEYYLSVLKEKHILVFSFCRKDDYNSGIIKKFLFVYSFIIYFFINTLFFNDSTMHKIYVDVGAYNFVYQISQILYSLIISSILNIIIRNLALTESNVITLKYVKTNIENKKMELIKYLYYKFIIFFIVSFFFLIIFWYYISCFCAIYLNTQIHLITDTLISFTLSIIYPFGFYLLAGILRILALRPPTKTRRFFYNLSQVIQFL